MLKVVWAIGYTSLNTRLFYVPVTGCCPKTIASPISLVISLNTTLPNEAQYWGCPCVSNNHSKDHRNEGA